MGPKCSQNKQQQQKRHRTREEKKLCVSFADSRIICKMFIIPFYESANKRAIVSKHTRCQQETKTQKKKKKNLSTNFHILIFFSLYAARWDVIQYAKGLQPTIEMSQEKCWHRTHTKKLTKERENMFFSVLFKAAAKCSRMKTQFSNHLFGDSHHRTQSCAKTLKNYL